MQKQSGVYRIINKIDGKVYIGSAVNLQQRWSDHRKHLRAAHPDRKQVNIYLYRAWKRDGEENFIFEVVEIVDDMQLLIQREQYYIDQGNAAGMYNLCPTAGNCFGRVVDEQGRANISKGRAGISPSTRTPEHLAKISEALKGRRPADVTLEASAAVRRGVPLTDEHKAKVSAGLTGKKRPPRSPEHIAKLKAAAAARMADPERRAALSQTMKERGIAPSHDAQQKGANARKRQ